MVVSSIFSGFFFYVNNKKLYILWYSTFTQIYTHWPDRNAVLASRQCLLHIKFMLKLQCKTTFWSNQRLCNWYLLLPQAALKRKTKDWLPRNQNKVSEWSDISTRGLLLQWASIIKFQLSGHRHHFREALNVTCSRHYRATKLLIWFKATTHSHTYFVSGGLNILCIRYLYLWLTNLSHSTEILFDFGTVPTLYRVPTEFWNWGYNEVQLLFFP